jgi:glycosyltransferase involved in cell wall biosynthesis
VSRVSVVVPSYNYGRYLPACVDSVLAQEGVETEVLVIDDASSDETPEIARRMAARDPRVQFRRHATNQGHIATYNEGLEWASGEYTVLLSADDLLVPGALGRAVRLLDSHPEVGFVYGIPLFLKAGRSWPRARTSSRRDRWQIQDGHDWIEDRCRQGASCIISPEVVIRTKVQREVGGFRAELPHTGDLEFWLRLAAHAAVGRILDADHAYYRLHNQNMHSQRFSAIQRLEQVKAAFDSAFHEQGHRITDRERLQEFANRALARRALELATEALDHGWATPELVEQLVEMAERIHPDAPTFMAHVRLRRRVRLGPRLSRRLRLATDVALLRLPRAWAKYHLWTRRGR